MTGSHTYHDMGQFTIIVEVCDDDLGCGVDSLGVEVSSSAVAESSFDLHQDSTDGATGLKVDVTRVFDPSTDSDLAVLLGGFQIQLSYPDASANPAFPAGTRCVNILDVRDMEIPITGLDFDNAAGIATFGGSDSSGAPWPADLGHALTRLTGGANQQCRVDLEMTSLSDVNGSSIAVPPVLSQTVQRGDARADGVVNIADALFIAQYLLGSRAACTATLESTCLHSVNAASVLNDGSFDQHTLADALFIAQFLAGMRDENYNLVP